MGKLNDFLTEAGVFFLATTEGKQAKLRPMGLHLAVDGKVFFGVGDNKEVYKQMLANPQVEIVALRAKDSHWLRFTGRAVFTSDPKYAEMALNAIPSLQELYGKPSGPRLAMYSLEDATAVVIPMMGPGETIAQD